MGGDGRRPGAEAAGSNLPGEAGQREAAWQEDYRARTEAIRALAAAAPQEMPEAPPQARPIPVVRTEAGTARVDLYEEIDPWFGIGAAEFCAAIGKVQGDLELHISSVGGNLFEALTIYSTLKQRSGVVSVVVDGLAASAASVIMLAASPDRLFVAENSTVMIHDALSMTVGNERDHQDAAAVLGRESDNIAGIYAARSGRPRADMRDLMRAETWFVGGAEAVAAGLADAVLPDGASPPPPGSWDYLVSRAMNWARVASAGPGTPGSAVVRAAVYSRWMAQSGRAPGRISPTVAAIFRL